MITVHLVTESEKTTQLVHAQLDIMMMVLTPLVTHVDHNVTLVHQLTSVLNVLKEEKLDLNQNAHAQMDNTNLPMSVMIVTPFVPLVKPHLTIV